MTTQTTSAATKQWQAIVTSVHDGDTFDCTVMLGLAPKGQPVDYGFHIYRQVIDGHCWIVLHAAIRLLGCNAIELSQPGGKEAQANLAALLPVGSRVTLSTESPDKYGGRYDAAVTLPDGTDLVTKLCADGWAAVWDGTGSRPNPPWPRTV